jgi:hypothetical protein
MIHNYVQIFSLAKVFYIQNIFLNNWIYNDQVRTKEKPTKTLISQSGPVL